MTGSIGETEVAARFRRLGWGVASNSQDDVGTDLWLMVRDDRLYELGLIAGAQVKSTADEFAEPAFGKGHELLGWWWRDPDRAHVDDWLAHVAPHFLVLHHLPTSTSHWVHVAPERVKSTGLGAKILVPVGNTVDERCRDDLVRAAATTRPGTRWEGSAWTGAVNMRPADALRHAMIVPRLVAPHPNLGYERPISPVQALAMLMQGRFRDLEYQASKHVHVPLLRESLTSDVWEWRFVAAVAARMLGENAEAILSVMEDAPDTASRVAATVAAAATLLERGLADQALPILEAAYERDDAEPVDHGWLALQMARACVEVGRTEVAGDLAIRIQGLAATHAEDPTATAIAGAGAILLFITTDWGSADVASAVAGGDNIAAWWQNQTIVTGLTAALKRRFSEWSGHEQFLLEDIANNSLYCAAFSASLLGDHPAWRHLSGLLARDGLIRLDRGVDPEKASRALQTLRLCGADDEMQHAVRRLIDEGPCGSVTTAARDVDMRVSTRTTAKADLTLLRVGGDLLEVATADAAAEWLLETVDDSSAFELRTGGVSWSERLVDTLAGVVGAASPPIQQLVAEHVKSLPPQQEESAATSWARVVAQLPEGAWDHVDLPRLADVTASHHSVLAVRLQRVVASRHAETREGLLDLAARGSLAALEALGDVTQLPSSVAAPLIEELARRARGQIEQAHHGRYDGGQNDVGDALALLNVSHPEQAAWTPIVDLIRDAAVQPEHKLGALRRLAGFAELIPTNVHEDLLAAAEAVATHPAFPTPLGGRGSSSPEAAELVAALRRFTAHSALDAGAELVALMAGDRASRVSATKIARRRGSDLDVGLLIALSQDAEPSVRAAAAYGLAFLVVRSNGGAAAVAALDQTAQDSGRRVPHAIATAINECEGDVPRALVALRADLQRHPSASVRAAATPELR